MVSSTVVLILFAGFIYENVEWFKVNAVSDKVDFQEPNYRIMIFALHQSFIIRSISFLSGFGLMFLGLAVSFHLIRSKDSVSVKATGFSANLTTASPGLIVTLFGVVLVAISIISKVEIKGGELPSVSANPLVGDLRTDEMPIPQKGKPPRLRLDGGH